MKKTFNNGSFEELKKERKEYIEILSQLVKDYKYKGDIDKKIPYNYGNFQELEAEVEELKVVVLKSTAKEVVESKNDSGDKDVKEDKVEVQKEEPKKEATDKKETTKKVATKKTSTKKASTKKETKKSK